MNTIVQNNITIYGDKVFIKNNPMPPCPAKNTNSSTVINDHIYIGGYELKNGQWKKTLKALWYKYF